MDSSRVKNNHFSPPFVARYVRIHPFNYVQKPALRLELLGCDINSELYQKVTEFMVVFILHFTRVLGMTLCCLCDQAARSRSGLRRGVSHRFLTRASPPPLIIQICCVAGAPPSPDSIRKGAPTHGGRW